MISRTAIRLFGTAAMTAATISLCQEANATEAVAGRYVPGALAGPGMGIVPPVPGMYWAISNVYYHGKANGEVPYGDNVVAVGLTGDIWVSALAGLYVPKWDLPGNWTYAVQAAVPVGWTGATAALGPFGSEDNVGGLGDIAVAPIVLGWHNDAMNTFVSTSLTIAAPTGVWQEGELAFVGLNYWTFTPAVAFTYLVPDHGLDFSANFGVDINTTNPDTDYYSGAMAYLDLALTKSVTENFSLGAVAGFLYQFEDDGSAFADTHDGFKGRSVAVGPLAKYKAKIGEATEIDFTFRWAHEVEVENRMKGDVVSLSIAGKF